VTGAAQVRHWRLFAYPLALTVQLAFAPVPSELSTWHDHVLVQRAWASSHRVAR